MPEGTNTQGNQPGQGAGTSPAGGGDGAGAGNEPTLDQLLDEWDSSGKGGEPSQPSSEKGGGQGSGDDVSSLKERLNRTEQRLVEQDYRREMDRVISTVQQKAEANPKFIEWWINDRADSDKRLRELWEQRDSQPQEWEKAINALADEFAKEYGQQQGSGSSQLDAQSQAIQAALSSGSRAPGGQDGNVDEQLAKMSDSEFELKKGEIFRQHAKSA